MEVQESLRQWCFERARDQLDSTVTVAQVITAAKLIEKYIRVLVPESQLKS